MVLIEKTARAISRFSPTLVDKTLKIAASSKLSYHLLKKIESFRLKKINKLQNILVVADINIGDAVIAQTLIAAIRMAVPNTKISYLYQKKAFSLIKTNPFIDIHLPHFTSIGFPSQKDRQSLMGILNKNNYDIVINLCPYFPHKIFKYSRGQVLYPLRLIREIINAYDSNRETAHIAYHMNKFSLNLVKEICRNNGKEIKIQSNHSFPHIFMGESLLKESRKVMNKLKLSPWSRKVLFNPDTASVYTLIPPEFQTELLTGLLGLDSIDFILVTPGYTFKGIEKKVISGIPPILRNKIRLLPINVDLDVYAAITDQVDVFISGDTAPLHIASARKYSIGFENLFKNQTAVIGIFGATSGKIYGYDSSSPSYFPSAQDAPSKIFESHPACKNLTCIDKTFKNCKEILCFEGLNPKPIVEFIDNYLT
jgi:ADP-heptose:LPS heptosyltransferase